MMEDSKHQSRAAIWSAAIGAVGVIIAALIGVRQDAPTASVSGKASPSLEGQVRELNAPDLTSSSSSALDRKLESSTTKEAGTASAEHPPLSSDSDIKIVGPDAKEVGVPRCSLGTIFASLPEGAGRALFISGGDANRLIDTYLRDAKKKGIAVDLAALHVFYFSGSSMSSIRARDLMRDSFAKKSPLEVLSWVFRGSWVDKVPNAEEAAAKLNADVICGF